MRMVPASDTLTLQAMGLVFGGLLGNRLSMQWVVYRDDKGRSRALRYRDLDVFLFPMTMISRRVEGDSDPRLRHLFEETVAETRSLSPGGKCFKESTRCHAPHSITRLFHELFRCRRS